MSRSSALAMTSSNTTATRQRRRESDKSVSRPKRSSAALAPNTTTRTRRSSTAASASASLGAVAPATPSSPPLPSAARDSTQSTFGGSVFSRVSHSTAATAASVPEETVDQIFHHRDSFGSIADDPFFQRFDTKLDAESLSRLDDSHENDAPTTAKNDSNDRELSHRWPPPRRESLTIGQSHILLSNYVSLRVVATLGEMF